VFTAAMGIAVCLNEIVYHSGLFPNGGYFDMFYISQHHKTALAVYSVVQENVPYPWCLLIYFAAVTLGSYLILYTAILIKKIRERKD